MSNTHVRHHTLRRAVRESTRYARDHRHLKPHHATYSSSASRTIAELRTAVQGRGRRLAQERFLTDTSSTKSCFSQTKHLIPPVLSEQTGKVLVSTSPQVNSKLCTYWSAQSTLEKITNRVALADTLNGAVHGQPANHHSQP